MGSRRFAPLFWCQFFAAFNDNFLKNALVILILFKLGGEAGAALVTLGGAVFIAPFFILSGLGGQLADRYDKGRVAERLKLIEIGAAVVAVGGFLFESIPILFVALFLFGALATLFAPAKYGLLPEQLDTEELPAGNALVEAATFLAILLGTIAGGIAAASGGNALALTTLIMAFAILSWLFARAIPQVGGAAPDLVVERNIVHSTADLVKRAWADTRIWRGSLIVTWFWVIGATLLALLPTLVKDTLGGNEGVITIYLACFSVGIAIGSLLASVIAGGRIVLLPTPVAAVLMGVFLLDIALSTLGAPPAAEASLTVATFLDSGTAVRIGIDFVGVAIAAGLFIVPIFAAVQAWSPPEERARVIGAINIISAACMVATAVVVAVLQYAAMSTPWIFVVFALASLVVGALVFLWLRKTTLRDFVYLFFRIVYRLEVRGLENTRKGGANPIFVCNHVGYGDGPLVMSLIDDAPVFAIDYQMASYWWVKPLLRMTKAMPVNPANPLATRTLINAVKAGEPLIIFPEGRRTVTGSLMKIYEGAAMVADKSAAFVIPVRLDGIEHGPFTHLRGQARRFFRPKVTVTFLDPVRLTVSPELRGRHRRRAAGAALYEIMSDLVFRTTPTDRTIVEAVIAAAKRHGLGHIVVEDPVTGSLTYRRLLAGAAVIGRKLMPLAGEGEAVGVMLPNANGTAVTVLGLMSAGRVPAMINFSAGKANILSACKAAKVGAVVTSRAFVEKARLEPLVDGLREQVRVVWLEDVRATVSLLDRLGGLWSAKRPLIERKPDDAAAILFTSGSEGTPKGVVLSHRNILSNAAQGQAVLDFGTRDKVFNVLPVFHSFGLTVGLILPLVCGVRVFLYPSPLHYRLIPELVYANNATMLFGTDTFLAGYARSADAYDFRSIRYVLAGAEPVKDSTRKVYMEKFGLRILEGYGVTETAPALAFNTPMFNKPGSVGRVLPGMEVRIEPVPGIEDGGRLFVRGPNVMLGYLRAENPGVLEPPPNGWHDTGDVVAIDGEGFVTIKGRAKRFAKIGGEMVSLAAVEALAGGLWPDAMSAAVAVPDPRKGERIVLVTTAANASRSAFVTYAKGRGASELMVPAEIIPVDAVPLLGSGKIDNVAVAALVAERHASLPRVVTALESDPAAA
jgi:acyl-[acyl-carrier-protein]-phospholipid O-acyltransferase/long-chain-fatty-acid--[acyl-carrier-protein] ligase